jgi:hypothetical protein
MSIGIYRHDYLFLKILGEKFNIIQVLKGKKIVIPF